LQQTIRGASPDDEILLGALSRCRVSRTQVAEAGANAAEVSDSTAERDKNKNTDLLKMKRSVTFALAAPEPDR
jgi:hypothetical protein